MAQGAIPQPMAATDDTRPPDAVIVAVSNVMATPRARSAADLAAGVDQPRGDA